MTPCTPLTDLITTTITTGIPAACLPLPAGATVACPTDITFTCTTGTPTEIAPGLVSVPVNINASAHTLIIRNAAGEVVCTITTGATSSTVLETVSCPVTAGVSCTCEFTSVTCRGCTFDVTGTEVVCTFQEATTVTCVSGVPQPTEIDCIGVNKIFDFCFQQDTAAAPCFEVPNDVEVPVGSTAQCTVTSVTCTAGTPVPTGVDGLATVSVVVTIHFDVTIISPTGFVVTIIRNRTFVFAKTAIVCAPVGTSADCTATVTCACVVIPEMENDSQQEQEAMVCCTFFICLLIETFAAVKLLVPTFGFCTPAPCRTAGFPPCPPTPLFPPQECGF
ncbi:MAG: hypothetical protein ACM3RP_11705 [Chitinophagales bacterium]